MCIRDRARPGCARMEREKAWPDTAAPPGRREGESLTSESGGIEYRCGCAGGLARSGGEAKGPGHSWHVRSINWAQVRKESRERAEVVRQAVRDFEGGGMAGVGEGQGQ